MESSEEPTSLQSICHLRASELFPKPAQYDCDDPTITVPFIPLSGEYIVALGRTSDGVLALSNYRLYVQFSQGCYNVPVGLLEHVEVKDLFKLNISCKDARSISCAFATSEDCLEWYKRIHKVTLPKKSIEDMFSFAYYAWTVEEGKECPRLQKESNLYLKNFNDEVNRLKFNLHGTWRISQVNRDFQMCSSYPPQLLVPACISDENLEAVGKFRSFKRIPTVVWRHTQNGAVIARSSQPEVGWLGWRSQEDEDLLKALADACSYDRGETTMIDSPVNESEPTDEAVASTSTKVDTTKVDTSKKVLIIDARSYTTAVANRARGGGCECPEYYPSCDIQFMNLPNIHSIRKSFHLMRTLCASDADQSNWLSALESTRWLAHMSGLLRAAVTVASAVETEGRPVLVHCSDGWDRTPQIVALAQILLDPYYRTIQGFEILCEREWLGFGHKFADRCGHTVGFEDTNEKCPVFLQWLDCVYQLTRQFKCSFQMSSAYLVKLAQHTYSQLFGTFLCNTRQERLSLRIPDRTFSVWPFLNSPSFTNHLYSPSNQVLWPSCNVRDLRLWTAAYLGTAETPLGVSDITSRGSMIDIESGENEETQGQMTKTRSYGDLIQVQDHTAHLPRRLSDPSISMEKKFDSLNLENEPEKVESNSDSDKPQAVSESNKETEETTNVPNENSAPSDAPVNTSVGSSTDTIIPNGEVIVTKPNDEKETTPATSEQESDTCWIDADGARHPCNRNPTEGSDESEISAPVASLTPSSISPASPIHQDIVIDNCDRLNDVDGLPAIQCDIQMRIQQIIAEYKLKEEALRKELHTTRMALVKQVCTHNTDNDRVDEIGSLPDSVGSAGDHGESLPSDMSWEALDEPGSGPTLWVPDHAVNRCMGCNTEFWLGRRKHHCRNCGKIFCADCSENSTPLPSEQLYNPVRVCSGCFLQLHHHSSTCQCTCRQASKLETEAENAATALVPPTMAVQAPPMGCHRSARKTSKDDSYESSFQIVQQKQSQQPPIVEASSAN